jgi:hypothetical protein
MRNINLHSMRPIEFTLVKNWLQSLSRLIRRTMMPSRRSKPISLLKAKREQLSK